MFGRRGHCRERTSGAEQVAYLLLGAACLHQVQPTLSIRTFTVTCDDTSNPHVHIDCSENADERALSWRMVMLSCGYSCMMGVINTAPITEQGFVFARAVLALPI